jgi:recombinational DNA repair ATPase RecF
MKIISFHAQNFKNLTAVEINPDGTVITLTGANGAGKSSILDGIEASLAGKDAVCEKPIRDGASRAKLETLLSNGFKITRVFTPGGSTL